MRYPKVGIIVGMKLYGIDESVGGPSVKLYCTHKDARDVFEKRIQNILNVTHGKKENEY
jgi:mevalonate pyrophosphate decarboxylase